MAKSLKKALVAIIGFAMTFAYFALPAKAAMLYNASLTLDNPLAVGSSAYTFTMKAKTANTIKGIKMQFLKTADPSSGNPTSISFTNVGANAASLTGLTGNWPVDKTDANTDIYYITKGAGDAVLSGADLSWTITGVNNPGINSNATGCSPRADTGVPNITDANASAGTCYVRVATYDTDTLATIQAQDPSGAVGSYPDVIDYTTIAFTVTTEVTMKAVVDSSMAFTVVGVNAGVNVADAGSATVTSDPSTYNTLDFKNIAVLTPKTMAHKLFVKTNAQNGYSVKIKSTTDSAGGNADANGILKGQYGTNNIDGFANDGGVAATFLAPQNWADPNSTSANTNSGYLGVNSDDTNTVFNGGAATKWAPLQNSQYNEIMTNSGPDLGGAAEAHTITYAIEVNVYQPADQYTGTFEYQATPKY